MLAQTAQTDFSAGMFQSVARHLIPADGAYDISNGLLDDSGSIYKRGGTDWHTTALAGEAPLTSVWDGNLAAGSVTVVSTPGALGVTDETETALVKVASAGALLCRPVEANGALVFPGGLMFAGARTTASYSTGTAAVTAGSKFVTGSGTAWASHAAPGMFLTIGTQTLVVAEVNSDTQLMLQDTAPAAASGAYTLLPIVVASTVAQLYATLPAGGLNRLVAAVGSRVFFSSPGDSFTWGANDYHELPDGATVLGLVNLRDNMLVFATNGLWMITGMALDLVDDFGNPQQRLDRVSPDLVLWGPAGIAAWANRLVVCATDAVWLIDGTSAPVRCSDAISTLYRSYVAAGHSPGQPTVWRGHCIIPIVSVANVVIDTLVVRLDQDGFPWARMTGHGASQIAYTVRSRITGAPALLGASSTDARVVACHWLDPSASNATDADGTTPTLRIVTRRYQTAHLASNMVRRVRATYEMSAANGSTPAISAYVGLGRPIVAPGAEWGIAEWGIDDFNADYGEFTALVGSAGESIGADPFVWPVNHRARFVSYRLECSDATANLTLRTLEQFIRQAAIP